MTPAQIGELTIVQAIVFCSWTILGFGLTFAVHKYYVPYKEDGDALVSSLWLARLIGGLPIYGLLLLGGYFFCQFARGSIEWSLVLMAITAGYLRGGISLVEFWLNIREKPVKYRLFTFCQFFLTTLLVLHFLVAKDLGVMGVVLSELISYSIFVFISAYVLFRKSLPNFKIVRWGEVLRYCMPALPYNFFMWGLFGIDRLILNEYVPRSEIGIYSVGYTLASCLSIVVLSMRNAWLPSFFKASEAGSGGKQFTEIAYIYLFIILLTALGGMLFAPEIVALFGITATESYARSAIVMQIVLLAFVANSFFLALNQPLFYKQRTGMISVISGFGLVINIAANLIMVPHFGILGSAMASIIAYGAIAISTYLVAKNDFTFEWETQKLLPGLVAFLLVATTAFFLPNKVYVGTMILKIMLLLSFVLLTIVEIGSTKEGRFVLRLRFQKLDNGAEASMNESPNDNTNVL